uniref:Uncharacterized protein n=1 Tax=Arundo donax TaxID=35708 RepID=A0A0A9GGU3_ARUDO
MLKKEETDFIAEKNPQAHVRRSMRESIVSVKDINGDGEEIQNAKGEDVEKQLVVKQPVRCSSRKSAPPDMLENKSGFQVAETNAEAHVRRSMRKSVLPNMLNKDHSKMARNDDFQSGRGGGEEEQLKVKEPVRRSVATVVPEKENKGLREEKKSEIPMRRSTRKSIALNAVEKENMDHTEMVGREQPGVGTRNQKARGQFVDCAVAVATPENKLQVKVAVENKRPAKRIRKTTPEAVMSMEEAKSDDMVIKEATQDGDKVTHEYNKESSRRIQEICQVNATVEEFSSDPLSETRTGELDKKSSTTALVSHVGIASEKTLMGEGEVNLGAKSKQIVNAGSYEFGLEASNKSVGTAQEISSTTVALIVEAEDPVDEVDTVNSETVTQPDEGVASPISSCCEDTTVTVMEPQFAWQKDSQYVSTDGNSCVLRILVIIVPVNC